MSFRISAKRWLIITLITLSGLCIGSWDVKTAFAKPVNQAVFLANSKQYTVNDTVYQMDMVPYFQRDILFVPIGVLTCFLGISDSDVERDYQNDTIIFKTEIGLIKVVTGENYIYINDTVRLVYTGPVLVNNQTLLPVQCIAEAMGYKTSWDTEKRALLIGSPDQLPEIPPELLKPPPIKVMPVELPKSFRIETKIAEASILFPCNKDVNNVTNAGLAAKYVNGVHLLPGEVFSFNQTIGPRTKEKGYINGFNSWHALEVGSGVCRMSTVLYQLAKKAGFQIIERHSHSVRVDYVPPGEDATVDYGKQDLRFKNNRSTEMVIYAALTEGKEGRLLWANLYEYRTPPKYDVAILRRLSGQSVWSDVEPQRLTAIGLNGVSYISLEQLGCALDWDVTVIQTGGKLKATLSTKTQEAEFDSVSKKAIINGQNVELKSLPFCLTDSNCKFWLPLRELTQLIEGEVIWVPHPARSIILNLSGSSIKDRPELRPKKSAVTFSFNCTKPYGYRELKQDLTTLADLHPSFIKIDSIGKSVVGNDIPLVTIGHGPKEVFISGAWHGEEYITAAYLVKFIEQAGRNYNNSEWQGILSNATLYIAPMINPDGCEIAAHPHDLPPALSKAIAGIARPGFDCTHWRANAQGIDLNAQFPIRWEVIRSLLGNNIPSRGKAGNTPLAAPEALSVYEFAYNHDLAAIFCYHSQGEIIYWRPVNRNPTPMMSRVTTLYKEASGYNLSNSSDLSGGFRDWFVSNYVKPGLTIEVGRGVNPIPGKQFETIWKRNFPALFKCLQELVRDVS